MVYFDDPKPGFKTTVRTDTDEPVETREMTEQDKQSVMEFLAEPES